MYIHQYDYPQPLDFSQPETAPAPRYVRGKPFHNARTFMRLEIGPRLIGIRLDEGFITAPHRVVMSGAEVARLILESDTNGTLTFDDAIDAMLCVHEGFDNGSFAPGFFV